MIAADSSSRKPRTLFLQHEQRGWFWDEPGHLEVYVPMVRSGLLGEVRTHPYQRDVRWLHDKSATGAGHDGPVNVHETPVDTSLIILMSAIFKEFRPDLVVYVTTWPQEVLSDTVLHELRRNFRFKLFSIIRGHDETNDLLLSYDKVVIGHSDLVALADSSLRASRIRNRQPPYEDFTNVDVVRFMPCAVDQTIFRPSLSKRAEVTIAGSGEGQRVEVYDRLLADGVSVRRSGGRLPSDKFLPIDAYARSLSETKILVNTQTLASRDQLKGRVGQALSSGTLLLEQWSAESQVFLEKLGLADLLWRSHDELLSKIRFWLSDDDRREAMAARARAAYLSDHDPTSYTRSVLGFLGLDR